MTREVRAREDQEGVIHDVQQRMTRSGFEAVVGTTDRNSVLQYSNILESSSRVGPFNGVGADESCF
jgi:hypothetical protein